MLFRSPERLIGLGILMCALGLRLRYLSAGVPYGVGIDEPAIVDRALGILQTGNWHPRGFDYPSLVIYLQASVSVVRFLGGALQGQWSSLSKYDISAVYEAGRLVAAIIGTATVWLTYRLGKDLCSPALGLVAAAALAVHPMHVRESHFILRDVPAAALVLLTLYLTVRAGRRHTVGGYALAGCAAGLAAAAEYNAAVVALVLGLAWLLHERASPDRWWKALAALVAVPLAFLAAVPYAIIDLPGFLNGFGAQMARFAPQNALPGADAPWRVYVTHLSLAWRLWVPTAILGAAVVLWRRQSLKQWAVPITFVMVYFYVVASHAVVFGRYALPLLPGLCLLAAVPVVELARLGALGFERRFVGPVLLVAGAATMTAPFLSDSLTWLREFHRPDTRLLAGRWMRAAIPKGTRIVAEKGGPTHLRFAGFDVVDQPDRVEASPDTYVKQGIDYVVIARYSAQAMPAYTTLVNAGRVVFQIEPSDERWGPFVRVVKLARPQ